MKLIQYISMVDTILRNSKMSRDSRISFPFLIDRWNAYRASHIRDSYKANMELDATLLQDLAHIPVTKRSLQDDPLFPAACMNMGKASIPAVVAMPYSTGIISVSTLSKERNFNQCHISEIVDRMRLENYRDNYWYAKLGNNLWIYPYMPDINVVAVLDDPLEGWVLNTEEPVNGQLLFRTDYNEGEQYKVVSGSVIHGGVTYTVGNTFEAVASSYNGNGKIEYVNKKRKMTIQDEYPMSATMAEPILMKILTQDFKLSKEEVTDIRNNMMDEAAR